MKDQVEFRFGDQSNHPQALKDVPVEERCAGWKKGGNGACKDVIWNSTDWGLIETL